MMVVGTRLFGKIDRLSNGWYVATKFGHLNYFPLIPAGSMLVVENDGRRWRGVPVPMSMRSWIAAWIRAVAFVAAVTGCVIGAVLGFDRHSSSTDAGISIGMAVIGVALFVGSMFLWRNASPAREEALLRSIEARAISNKLPPARGFDVLPAAAPAQKTATAANASPPPLPLADEDDATIPLADASPARR